MLLMMQMQQALLKLLLAMVKVLPEPVTPNRVCAGVPLRTPSTSCAMAEGWSPIGVYGDSNLKFIVCFSIARCEYTKFYSVKYSNTTLN